MGFTKIIPVNFSLLASATLRTVPPPIESPTRNTLSQLFNNSFNSKVIFAGHSGHFTLFKFSGTVPCPGNNGTRTV